MQLQVIVRHMRSCGLPATAIFTPFEQPHGPCERNAQNTEDESEDAEDDPMVLSVERFPRAASC
jgi:hypothetical protein